MWLFFRFLVITAVTLLLGDCLGWANANAADMSGSLAVRVQGLISDDGNVRVTLFDSKKNFLKRPIRTGVMKINDHQATWIFEEVPYGTYAVLVHHDVNASETMERHWYGKPKEPTGASNDAPAKFGPPRFDDAKFQFESPTLSLSITVQ